MNQAVKITPNVLIVNKYPHFIKYMGSKSKIMDFVVDGINEVHAGGPICDLFAGSASLAGAIGDQVEIHSNDIQEYSGILANTYLNVSKNPEFPSFDEIYSKALKIYKHNSKSLGLKIDYKNIDDLGAFNDLEKIQQKLIDRQFRRKWHLFVKNYSGTWWTTDQCLWIDALRQVADEYKSKPAFYFILSCLMYAMAYTSQGTGHYAQYRDAKTKSSMKDILIYRKRSVINYFKKKFSDAQVDIPKQKHSFSHTITTLDFSECLAGFSNGTVYADPPYCFVHYSRFYHAIETIVLYDYPKIQVQRGKIVKGRYREIRHQSPFCIKTKVPNAFRNIFKGIKKSKSSLVLSYSDTGMISIDDLWKIAEDELGSQYKLDLMLTDHKHMTLGRRADRDRNVKECLFLAKLI